MTRDVVRLRDRLRDLVAQRRSSARQARGSAELSVVVVALSLVAGLFFGDGLSRTAVQIADGVTWLSDDPSGEVIQVNPATGRPEVRLDVSAPGHDLDLAQHDGHLYVLDRTTGTFSAIDVSTLIRTSQRRVSGGGAVDTLTHDGLVFLLDRSLSTLARIDPVTGDEIGAVWVEDDGLADAAIDRQGTVWSLDDDGTLTELRWSEPSQAFTVGETRTVDHSGPGSVLVAHETGVTVFGPDDGLVYQVGTGHDVIAGAPGLSGALESPEWTPADLAVVTAPEHSTVVLVTEGEVREVDVSGLGCTDPGRPEVFDDRVFVPCRGAAKVVQLGRDGKVSGPEIPTPGSQDPELVRDDDHLLVNTPGASRGYIVRTDGTVGTIVRYDDDLETITPRQPESSTTEPEPPEPPAPEDGAVPPGPRPGEQSPGGRRRAPRQGRPPTSGPPTPGSTPTLAGPTSAPTPTGSPTTPPSPGPSTTPIVPGPMPTTLPTATASPTAPTPGATPTVPTPTVPSPTSTPASPTPTATPTPRVAQAPTGVRASSLGSGQVQVDWDHAGTDPDSFRISREGGGQLSTVGGAIRQAVVTVTPGQSARFVVTSVVGTSTAASAASNAVTASGVPGQATGVAASGVLRSNGKIETYTLSVSWGAAPDNGSAITGYRVTLDTGSQTWSQTMPAGARSATTSSSCDLEASPGCSAGGAGTATVTAISSEGAGPTVSANARDTSAPPPPLPGGGRDHVSGTSFVWHGPGYEGNGTATVDIAPPGDWAGFEGSCRVEASGAGLQGGDGIVSCGVRQLQLQFSHGIVRTEDGTMVEHTASVRFVASNGSATAASATHTFTYRGSSLCRQCQIP